MKVEWKPLARADLESVRAYIEEHNLEAAAETAYRILDAVKLLQQQPAMGRPGRVHRTREWVVNPYVLVYTVEKDKLVIVRVLHGAQKWP